MVVLGLGGYGTWQKDLEKGVMVSGGQLLSEVLGGRSGHCQGSLWGSSCMDDEAADGMAGAGAGLQPSEANPQWPTSAMQAPLPDGSTASHKGSTRWGPSIQSISLCGTFRIQSEHCQGEGRAASSILAPGFLSTRNFLFVLNKHLIWIFSVVWGYYELPCIYKKRNTSEMKQIAAELFQIWILDCFWLSH